MRLVVFLAALIGLGLGLWLSANAQTAPAPIAVTPKATTSVTISPRPYVSVAAQRTTTGTYTCLAGATGIAVYRNGLRQFPDVDYTVDATAGEVIPKTAWDAADLVLLDFYR